MYVLDEKGEPVPTDDVHLWGRMFQNENRIIAKETVGEAEVSTVFLGLDHNLGDGPPLLYETMIFGGPHDGYQRRYTTRDEALACHTETVHMLDN